tara:strand:+ start:280 stop:489 length:210 start_codon:yes stop_codon:yes gene_type:complete
MVYPIAIPSHLWGEKSEQAADRFLRVLPSLLHSDPKMLELEYKDLLAIVQDEFNELEIEAEVNNAGSLT